MKHDMRIKGLLLSGLISGLFSGGLSACSNMPNHVGNPLTLPGRAITNGISEAKYNARRNHVEEYIEANLVEIHKDIDLGEGLSLDGAMDLAGVALDRRAELYAELASNPRLYKSQNVEPLLVAIMVYSD